MGLIWPLCKHLKASTACELAGQIVYTPLISGSNITTKLKNKSLLFLLFEMYRFCVPFLKCFHVNILINSEQS